LVRNYGVVGVYAGGFTPAEDTAALQQLGELAARGEIKTPVSNMFAFAEVPRGARPVRNLVGGGRLPSAFAVMLFQPRRRARICRLFPAGEGSHVIPGSR